jgi:hypothetical protein
VGPALAINRQECRIGATAVGRFLDVRIDLRIDLAQPPVGIGDGVGLDFDMRKRCVLRLDGRRYRAPLVHMGDLVKKLRLASPVRLLATT